MYMCPCTQENYVVTTADDRWFKAPCRRAPRRSAGRRQRLPVCRPGAIGEGHCSARIGCTRNAPRGSWFEPLCGGIWERRTWQLPHFWTETATAVAIGWTTVACAIGGLPCTWRARGKL
jgi:hypothetical protein